MESQNQRLIYATNSFSTSSSSSSSSSSMVFSDMKSVCINPIGGSDYNETIDLNASLTEEDSDVAGKDPNKLCARGHWRPAEDTKLKELVALYGPQNWNLIAEKLEGRSGMLFLFIYLFIYN